MNGTYLQAWDCKIVENLETINTMDGQGKLAGGNMVGKTEEGIL